MPKRRGVKSHTCVPLTFYLCKCKLLELIWLDVCFTSQWKAASLRKMTRKGRTLVSVVKGYNSLLWVWVYKLCTCNSEIQNSSATFVHNNGNVKILSFINISIIKRRCVYRLKNIDILLKNSAWTTGLLCLYMQKKDLQMNF